MKRIRCTAWLAGLIWLLVLSQAGAEEKLEPGKDRIDVPAIGDGLCLHNLFQSGMVLQRDKPIRIWDWAAFLGRNDPVCDALPQKFDHGAFAGNGTLGLTVFQEDKKALRFAMGRNDVTSRARDNTRLLMGGLRLTTKGKIIGGELRTDLWNAEIRGTVATDAGGITFRALVHAKRNVVVIDCSGSGGEAACAWSWMPEKAVTGQGRYDSFENLANPPCVAGQTDGVAWCEQKRTAGGSYTAAWTEKTSRLLFTIADTFPQDESQTAAVETVRRAAAEVPDDLLKSHRDWWHAYYPASFVSVPDARIEGFYWIQMYKLASAMRPDGMVMDLQGPWNRATDWPRIWWNLNIQIAYSPVYAANRLELGESFTRFIDSRRQAFVANAKELWGFDDCATTPHTTSYDGTNGNGLAAKDWSGYINPGDFTWALWLYWQQYRYSMDESLVKDQGKHAFYPLLKASVNLYLHLLKPGEDGKLHLPKMHSPEYGDAADNNYNLSLLRWGCGTLLALNERYHLDDPQIPEWKRVLNDLTPYPQNENGFMVGAELPFARSHRHWAHMLMVWPLHMLSCEQPDNKELVKKSLRHWLTVDNAREVYGWSAAAAAHFYATLGDGENALKQLRSHHDNKQFVMPNTQYIEGSPVYECSLVAASSLQYMLLQSWGGTMRIFPAMPQEWRTANYQNLRAEGAFLVSAIRKDGRTSWVRIESLAGEPCRVKPDFTGAFACDRPDKLKELGNGVYELALKKGESAVLYQGEREQAAQPCDLGGQKSNAWGLKQVAGMAAADDKNPPADANNWFAWKSDIPDDCPFERSKTLTGIFFTGRHSDYHCGDTIYPSWASDGNLYSPWTDGITDGVRSGSGDKPKRAATTGHAVMTGDDPLQLIVKNTSPPKEAWAKPYRGRYPCGSLVHNGIWYYGTYCLGPAGTLEHRGFKWNWPNLGPMPGFQISRDLGKTWEPSPLTPDKPLFPEPKKFLGPVKMGAPHFVDFGKNMEHSPDGKAYLIGMGAEENDPKPRPCIKPGPPGTAFVTDSECPDKSFANGNLSWISADQVYLARVKPSPETINQLAAYEFFAGHDGSGKPVWTADFAKIKPLIEWNNHMGCVTATYVPGLKKYLMCITDGWPTVAKMTSYILEADDITGPWRMVVHMKDFGEQAYFLNFPSKFISADGRTLWLCYSANFSPGWNGVDLKINPPGGRYGLCLHEVKLLGPNGN